MVRRRLGVAETGPQAADALPPLRMHIARGAGTTSLSACGFPARQVSHRGRTGLAERRPRASQGRTGKAGEEGRLITEGRSSR